MTSDDNQPAPHPRRSGLYPQPAGEGAGDEREMVLTGNGRRYVFRCAPGEEGALLDRLASLARDPHTDLTWFDAAVLSHQIGIRLGCRLQRTQRHGQ